MSRVSRVLEEWVEDVTDHTKPDRVHWCSGSAEEFTMLVEGMVEQRALTPLNPETHPRSYLYRSDPTDVARTEHLTFISTTNPDDAGPTNNWMSRTDVEKRVWSLLAGSMKGRTMYVVPYLMGPVGSPYSRVGVELTDSAYVAANLLIMTRAGDVALEHLKRLGKFVKGVHSLGDLSPERRFIVHLPEEQTILSIGSGYGGNALLSKKCHALRIASYQGRQEGWLAEHMLILGVTNPQGEKHYLAAAFPSACGKTNLAMLVPTLPGWKVETVGDDICWMHVGEDGRLWAINPEAGMFGVAPGTSKKTNPNALASLSHDVIFTNVAQRADGSPWWEGLSDLADGEQLRDWRGQPWKKGDSTPAAHPNSRFTVPIHQCPSVTESVDNPKGVPISAIVFGGRRAKLAPLVYEALSWNHGVFLGASMVSETTAAATGATGVPRNDPMAMLPFCGYNMADYFGHWLSIGKRLTQPPKIFHVNWFRTDDAGRHLWPGFGDNIRVIDWMLRRVSGQLSVRATPIGLTPRESDLDLSGLSLEPEQLRELLRVDWNAWLEEGTRTLDFFKKFGSRLPVELWREHDALISKLRQAQA